MSCSVISGHWFHLDFVTCGNFKGKSGVPKISNTGAIDANFAYSFRLNPMDLILMGIQRGICVID